MQVPSQVREGFNSLVILGAWVICVRINCIGQLGLGLLPLGPQPIRVRVGEAQLLVLLPPLAAALLAAGPRGSLPPI
jgi:hypothetical protein